MVRRGAVAVLAALVITVVPAAAQAQTGTFRTCVKSTTGAMRMLATARATCRKGERLFRLQQADGAPTTGSSAGAPGPAGPAGPAGPVGPQGPAGAQGPSGSIQSAPAGGALDGSYPDPGIRDGAIVRADLAPSVIEAFVASNDRRLTDARPPTGAASGDLTGTYPAPELKPSSVRSPEVGDLSLTDDDLARGSVTTYALSKFEQFREEINPPSIGPGGCAFVALTTFEQVALNDLLLPFSTATTTAQLILLPTHQNAAGAPKVRVCNISAGTVDATVVNLDFVVIG